MKKMIALSTVSVLATSAAYAGGLVQAPAEPLVMAPTPVATTDWSGAYGGLSLGYGGIDAEGSDLLDDEDDVLNIDVDGDGVVGGAFAGYQQDFGSFVLGAEVDLNAANVDFDDDDFFGGDVNVDFDEDGEIDNGGASMDRIHRLKLRAGYDAGNTLIYGVAGAAHANAEIFGDDYSDTGYVVGAGVDYMVRPNMTVGGEVLYHNWDDFDDTGIDFDATTFQARVALKF